MLESSLLPDDLADYVSAQLNHLFPDRNPVRLAEHKPELRLALDRLEHSFLHIRVHHYCRGDVARFDHLFSDQYAAFLWFLGNTLWQQGADPAWLNKLFYANKTLHGLECMYSTALPSVFFFSHTVGTVLGKATYGNYFFVSQGCTVGQHHDVYPVLGEGVGLAAGASVIGQCTVGAFVSIGSGTKLFAQDVAPHTTVFFDADGKLVKRASVQSLATHYFNIPVNAAGRTGTGDTHS